MAYSYKLLFLVVALSLLEIGATLNCYSCTTLKNNKCEDPYTKETGDTLPCNESGYGCMKQIVTATGQSPRTIHRGCTPEIYCASLSAASEHCTICNTDLCNSSSIVAPSIITGMLLIISVFLLNN